MSSELLRALQDGALYNHPVQGFQLVETHISWVLLTGPYAYKIKKPMDFGFLNFTSLESRRQFCHKELELNRRLAPELYLEVLPITGTPEQPQLGGEGTPFEYAIKMRQFDQEQLFDRLQLRQELTSAQIDELTDQIAQFHRTIAQADPASEFGQPEQVFFPVQQNFDQIRPLLGDDKAALIQLEQLQAWAQDSYQRLIPTFARRKAEGFIRECHGDIHLGNITLVDGKATLFDCIEFNESFRWTDVMADLAFLIMDLEDRGLKRFANRVLNRYLEHTGDYGGLEVLNFYKAYRAMVRAKVALFTKGSPGASAEFIAEQDRKYRNYADLAESYTFVPSRCLVITHGVSGSGKSTLSNQLVDRLGFVRLRSDIERKRLHGLAGLEQSGSELNGGIYGEDSTQATYQRLADLAEQLLRAGYAVIADATFLQASQRALLEAVAEAQGVPYLILSCEADLSTIRDWISARQAARNDASEAGLEVLDQQLAQQQPLTPDEASHQVIVHTDRPDELEPLLDTLSRRLSMSVAAR